VLLFHYGFRGYATGSIPVRPYAFLMETAKYGYLGVDFFFIISGFVIPMTAASGSPKRFLLSRIARLYPAYLVCCSITFVMILALGSPQYQASLSKYLINLTMLNGFIGVPDMDGVYWSLNIEIRFYTLMFLALALGGIRKYERLLLLWMGATLLLSKWHVPLVSSILIPDYSPYFIGGSNFYLIYQSGMNFSRVCIAICSFALAAIKGVTSKMDLMASANQTDYNPFLIAVIITSFFIVFTLIATKKLKWLSTPQWLPWGAITYPLYLIHQYVGYMLINLLCTYFNGGTAVLVSASTMLALAYAINRYIEVRYSARLKEIVDRSLSGISRFTQTRGFFQQP
jgi:peptidoglycan/LPS O-acetylase OafA/YrhL